MNPSARRIVEIVRRLLQDHSVDRPPVPIDRIARACGALVERRPFDGETCGFLLRQDDAILIGVNSAHHRHRQRFTVAHELGHMLMHRDEIGEVHVDHRFAFFLRDESSSTGEKPLERAANRFAAEILMPADFLRRDVREADIADEGALKVIARRYGVSVQAMTYRLANLGVIDL